MIFGHGCTEIPYFFLGKWYQIQPKAHELALYSYVFRLFIIFQGPDFQKYASVAKNNLEVNLHYELWP